EAQPLEHPAEEPVQLVAVAPTSAPDDLLPGVAEVEGDRNPPVDVEILERHRGETPPLHSPQEGNRRPLPLDRQQLEERPELSLTERARNRRRRGPGGSEGGFEKGRVQHRKRSN